MNTTLELLHNYWPPAAATLLTALAGLGPRVLTGEIKIKLPYVDFTLKRDFATRLALVIVALGFVVYAFCRDYSTRFHTYYAITVVFNPDFVEGKLGMLPDDVLKGFPISKNWRELKRKYHSQITNRIARFFEVRFQFAENLTARGDTTCVIRKLSNGLQEYAIESCNGKIAIEGAFRSSHALDVTKLRSFHFGFGNYFGRILVIAATFEQKTEGAVISSDRRDHRVVGLIIVRVCPVPEVLCTINLVDAKEIDGASDGYVPIGITLYEPRGRLE